MSIHDPSMNTSLVLLAAVELPFRSALHPLVLAVATESSSLLLLPSELLLLLML
jgi:hypothetical protein